MSTGKLRGFDRAEHPLHKAEVSLRRALIASFLHETADEGWMEQNGDYVNPRGFKNVGIAHLMTFFNIRMQNMRRKDRWDHRTH